MKVILSASSKGGVGKSQVAKETAYQLNRDGHEVAMMDADIDSSNLASRMGVDGRVEHTDNDQIKPVEKDGIKIYSMESAFSDSSFSQSGEFMRVVIRNMVEGTDWNDPDYLVVDTPPGTKDIFDELVKVLRDDLLGAIVVGQSDTIDDVGRMVKVCNHNYVPIIGFVENMSGIYMHGEIVTCDHCDDHVAPFGKGKVEALSKQLDGKFLGPIPLCNDPRDITDAAKNTIKGTAIAIQNSQRPTLPDLNEGEKGFIRNVWGALKAVIKTANEEFNVGELQEKYGNPENPKILQIRLTDAKDSWVLPSKINLKIENGFKRAKNPSKVHGVLQISSQELKWALEGERLVMDSAQALYSDDVMDTTEYSLVQAVQMGKADVRGEDVINHLSLMDKVFEDVIDTSKIQEAVKTA